MLLEKAARYPLLFFSGKGGVGKTTSATAIGYGLSQQGKKVLVVSVDPAHNLGHLMGVRLPDKPQQVAGLWLYELQPQQALHNYLDQVRGQLEDLMPRRLYPEIKAHLQAAATAPGAFETATFEALAQLIVQHSRDYDHIIVDTAPSGQTTRLLQLPEVLDTWVTGLLRTRQRSEHLAEVVSGLGGAPMDNRYRRIRERLEARQTLLRNFRALLQDSQHTGLIIVTLPERTPLLEAAEFADHISQAKITIPAVIVNRCTPNQPGEFFQQRRAHEAQLLADAQLLTQYSTTYVPFFSRDVTGTTGLELYLDQLTQHATQYPA